jgi:GT2 family glycosyltransferase
VRRELAGGTGPPPVQLPVGVAPRTATVVVATCGRPDLLRRAIDSILVADTTGIERLDVLVADNTTDPSTTAAVVAGYGADVRVVHAPRPGLANAHNAALSAVLGEIVAFTDDDVVVDRLWIRSLTEAFAAAADVVCVTGLIAPLELETAAQEFVEQAVGYAKGFAPRVYRRDDAHHGPLFPFAAGTFGSGANMAFRTGWLRAAGGFDPALGAGTPARGGDDLAAFYGAVVSGGALVYEPAAIVFHPHHRDSRALGRQAFSYGAGLTAYLSSVVTADRRALGDMLRRIGPAVRHVRAIERGGVDVVPTDAPRGLPVRRLVGMAVGPFLYARSRRRNPRTLEPPAVPRRAYRDVAS